MKEFVPRLLAASLLAFVCTIQAPSQHPKRQDNLNVLIDFLRRIPSKSEFEKTADYDSKVAQLLKQAVYDNRSGDSTWVATGGVGLFAKKIEYDPDKEIMTFPFAPSFWHLLPEGSQCTSFVDNGEGAADLGLIFTNYDEFFMRNTGLSIRNYVSYGTVKVTNSDAPSLKANARVAYFFKPSKPFTGDCFSRPSIVGKLEAIQIFDSVTGRVFYDTRPKGSTPTTKRSQPVPVKGGDLFGKAISLALPDWPSAANAVRLPSSQVVVDVLVSETGGVITAKGVSGPSILFEAAVAAALKSRFSPTLLSGRPVQVKGSIRYNYVPNTDSSLREKTSCDLCGEWKYMEPYATDYSYLRISKEGNRYKFVTGFSYENRITWQDGTVMLRNGKNIYLNLLAGKLTGKFVSENFRATHGYAFTYRISCSMRKDRSMDYWVWVEGELEKHIATRVE